MALSHSLVQGFLLLCELPNPGLGLVDSGSVSTTWPCLNNWKWIWYHKIKAPYKANIPSQGRLHIVVPQHSFCFLWPLPHGLQGPRPPTVKGLWLLKVHKIKMFKLRWQATWTNLGTAKGTVHSGASLTGWSDSREFCTLSGTCHRHVPCRRLHSIGDDFLSFLLTSPSRKLCET